MSLMTYNELCILVATGVISPVPIENINAASIDVRLGDTLLLEDDVDLNNDDDRVIIDLSKRESPKFRQYVMGSDGFLLQPFDFCLAQTLETFNLPDDIACEFRLKSSMARAGLNQSLAVWCDPGWNGSVLTLELQNVLAYHSLLLKPGMKIGQMVFFQGEKVPRNASYGTIGSYNGDASVTASKGCVESSR